MQLPLRHMGVEVTRAVQARGQRLARPERRLIEADFSPGRGTGSLSADPYNRVYATGSAETIGASRTGRDGMITKVASSRFHMPAPHTAS